MPTTIVPVLFYFSHKCYSLVILQIIDLDIFVETSLLGSSELKKGFFTKWLSIYD